MIHLKIEGIEIKKVSRKPFEGSVTYTGELEEELIINFSRFIFDGTAKMKQEEWPEGMVVKITLTHQQNTELLSTYPELALWVKMQELPIHKHDDKVEIYFRVWMDIELNGQVMPVSFIESILPEGSITYKS